MSITVAGLLRSIIRARENGWPVSTRQANEARHLLRRLPKTETPRLQVNRVAGGSVCLVPGCGCLPAPQ